MLLYWRIQHTVEYKSRSGYFLMWDQSLQLFVSLYNSSQRTLFWEYAYLVYRDYRVFII